MKRLSTAELMAEYWRSSSDGWRAANLGEEKRGEEAEEEGQVLLRMASLPHFEEVIPRVDQCSARFYQDGQGAQCTLHVGHRCPDHLDDRLGVRWKPSLAGPIMVPEDDRAAPLDRDYRGNYHPDYWAANP